MLFPVELWSRTDSGRGERAARDWDNRVDSGTVVSILTADLTGIKD
jgi:hypothetical protein